MNIKRWSKPLIILGVVAGAALLGTLLYLSSKHAKDAADGRADAAKGGVYAQSREISEIKPRKEEPPSAMRQERPVQTPPPKRQPQPLPLEVNLFTSSSSGKEPATGENFAPYGRLIKCRTVMTVDSSKLQTPVIGEVMEELWHTGPDGVKRMIVERGVEVHGTAQGNAMRDRISTGTDWVLVWRNADSPDVGKELPLKGIALEFSQEPDGEGFTITDGSAGIPGYVVQGSELKEVIALISTFVSGLGAGLVQSDIYTDSEGNTTTSYDGNLKTAVALGVQRSAELYAQRMLRKIAEESSYVRAPAGTPFYLYVTQTLDLGKARITGTVIEDMEKESKGERRASPSQAQVQPAQRPQLQTRQERQ